MRRDPANKCYLPLGWPTNMNLSCKPMIAIKLFPIVAILNLLLSAPGVFAGKLNPETLPRTGCNMNWASFHPTSPSLPLTNVLRIADNWSSAASFERDARGYPTRLNPGEAATTRFFGQNPYPTGPEAVYTLRWEGRGTLEIAYRGGLYRIDEKAKSPIKLTFPEGTKGPVELTILSTDPTDRLRDLRFYLPGYDDGSNTWTDHFLEFYSNFDIARFSWGAAVNHENASHIVEWEDRRPPTHFTYGMSPELGEDYGVPYEVMIELVNTLDIDLWVNIPHLVSDDYLRTAARLFRDQLEPGRRVWIELGNEVWNNWFPAYHDLTEEARQATAVEQRQVYLGHIYGRRALNMFRIFGEVFSITGDRHRLVTVLAGQSGWFQPMEQAFGEIEREGGVDAIDVLAIAPYFGPNKYEGEQRLKGLIEGKSPTDYELDDPFWNEIEDVLRWAIDNRFDPVHEGGAENMKYRALSLRTGIPLVAYEGGQHVESFSGGEEWIGPWVAPINRHPLMVRLYEYYLDAWQQFSGHTFLFHVDIEPATSDSAFGFKETYLQPDEEAVKFAWYLDWRARQLAKQKETP